MNPQFLNLISPSFTLFLDHEILYKGGGFINVNSGIMQPKQDPNFPDKTIYATPYRQFVSDYSINGANIPSGINIGSQFIPKNSSGLYIDYDMGRAILNGSVSKTLNNININYAYKEYNIYYNESQDDTLIFEAKYPVRPSQDHELNLEYNQITYPAVFVRTQFFQNQPFAFGGLDTSNIEIRAMFLADSPYLLDAGMSISADMSKKYFPVLNPKDMPFNVYGDYKNNINYNYLNLCSQYSQTGSLMALIDNVSISRFAPSVNKLIGNNAYGAFADFSVQFVRSPRV
jgi:hypothetical protein